MNKFIDTLIKHAKLYFFLALSLFIVLSFGLFKWKSDFSTPGWFPADSARIKDLFEYKQRFGGRGTNYAAIGITFPEGKVDLAYLKKIEKDFLKVPYIEGVESVNNYRTIYKENGQIVLKTLSEKFPDQEVFLEKVKEYPEVRDHVISRDQTYYILHAWVNDDVDYKNLSTEFTRNLEKVIEENRREDHRYMILGSVTVTHTFAEYSKSDNMIILPLMMFLAIALLYWRYRNFIVVALSLGVVTMSTVSAYGFLFYIGRTFNNVLVIIPGLLLATIIAQTVHIFLSFFHELNKHEKVEDALKYSFKENVVPTLLTDLTTSVGFAAITFTELMPISSLGIGCLIGTITALIYTHFIMPYIVIKFHHHFRRLKNKTENETSILTPLPSFIQKYKMPLMIVLSSITIWSLIISPKVVVDSDLLDYFPADSQVRLDYDHGYEKMHGAFRRFPFVVDSGKENGIYDPTFLKKVELFTAYMYSNPETKIVYSALDNIKETNKAIHDNDPKFYVIPETEKEVKGHIELYESLLPPGKKLRSRISMDNRYLNLRIYTSLESSKEYTDNTNRYMKYAMDTWGLKVQEGGFFAIYNKLNDLVAETFANSSIFVFIVIFIVMLLAYRNFFYACIGMIPNIVPVSMMLTFMYYTGINLNLGNSIVTAICLGVAVDDTVHFMHHYVTLRRSGKNAYDALAYTYQHAGNAILFTTVVLTISFGCFMLAEFIPNKQFGLLCALGLVVALVLEIFLLPTLLLMFDKKVFKEV